MPPVEFTQSVKEQTDIVRVIGDYVRLKKAGAQNWAGLCPFHKKKTALFSVHRRGQFPESVRMMAEPPQNEGGAGATVVELRG